MNKLTSQKKSNQLKDLGYKREDLKDWEFGKVKVFLLAGRISAGKSTVANFLFDALHYEYPSAIIKIAGFADGVKEVATQAFGWDGIKDEKGRRLLQVVGTDAGRAYNNNIWAEKAFKDNIFGTSFPPNILIFDDWRFPNEYTVWLDKPMIENVYKIRVFRDEEVISDHLSEKSLPSLITEPDYYDYRFDNNIEKNQILYKVREMLGVLEV